MPALLCCRLVSRLPNVRATVFLLACCGLAATAAELRGQGSPEARLAPPITQGQRIFFTGHSFHMFMPPILQDLAAAAGIRGQEIVGRSGIGGSKVIQHWDAPDEKSHVKQILSEGKVDVLTLAPIYLPDPGIEKFATLAYDHNPNIRITVQEIWLRWDLHELNSKERPKTVDHNATTIAQLRERSAPLFESIDEHVRELNKKFPHQVLFVVPTGDAVNNLREKIVAGQVPGITQQEQLFTDALGHGTAPLQALVAYCHFAVIYRRNPTGLARPTILKNDKHPEWNDDTNRVLQEVAWTTVVNHPLTGLRLDAGK